MCFSSCQTFTFLPEINGTRSGLLALYNYRQQQQQPVLTQTVSAETDPSKETNTLIWNAAFQSDHSVNMFCISFSLKRKVTGHYGI